MSVKSRICALSLLAMMGVAHASVSTAADLTIGAYAGVWEQSLRKCAIGPFEKATGKTIELVFGAPVQWINQVAANPLKPPIDVVFMPADSGYDVIKRGLADKFTIEKVPNLAQLYPQFSEIGGGFGVTHNYGGLGVIYNKKTVPNPPKSWREFVERTTAGEWQASIAGINVNGSLYMTVWHFANLYGGGITNILPGIQKVKEMLAGGKLEFWNDPNQVLNSLKSGDLDIASYWDGRAWAFINGGNTDIGFAVLDPGATASLIWLQKIKNSRDLGWDFINSTLSAEVQGCFASTMLYGVGNSKAVFDPKVESQITKYSTLVFPPIEEIGGKANEWIETWNKEIGR